MKTEIDVCGYFNLKELNRSGCPKHTSCEDADWQPCINRLSDCLGITKECDHYKS